MATKKTVEEIPAENRFTKQQLIKSKKYASKADVLGAVLLDSETYTFSEVDKLADTFLKGKVN
jgi:hypothetical protein